MPHAIQVRGLHYDEAVYQCKATPHKAARFIVEVGAVGWVGVADVTKRSLTA